MSQPSILKSDGVETEIDTRIDTELPVVSAGPTVLAERDGVQVHKQGDKGFNIVNVGDNTPATGYIFDVHTGSLFTVEEMQERVNTTKADLAAPPTPPMSTSGTSSGVPTFDAGVAVPESAPAPTVADALANFNISQYMLDPAIGLETPDKIAFQNLLTLTGTDVGAAADALFEAGTTLRGVPTQPITAEFNALMSEADRQSLRGYNSVDIVEHVITNAQGQQISEFVFLNPTTGQPILDLTGNPLLASGGQFLTDEAEAVNAAARELTSAKIARDDAATIAAKQAVLQSALNRQAQRETDIFHQQGNRYQAMLQAQLDFTSRAALDTASRNFQAEQAQQQREFEANLAEFQANNQFLMQALGFEFQNQQRMMELSWLNGSPEEAKFAREQSREIERRQIALQERELLVSTLAILGQHPQLRGAIQALGLFKGQGGGTGFDFEQFFSGTLPTDAIPSAQEFNLLSPSAQEAMVNDLAGKHGISRDIIIQTIRRQAPAGTRRLA
jgi:hypothetical protein